MKLSTTLALAACAGIAAFFLGRGIHSGADVRPDEAVAHTRSAPARPLPAHEAGIENLHHLSTVISSGISPEQAARLTSQERMELLASGGSVYLTGNQTAVLCGLISSLHKDEMHEAMKILGGIQDRGNGINQEVWDTFWKQWGRVDPAGCLVDFGENAVSKNPGDARNVMKGWLEMNADAALAWANQPHSSPLEADAAATAISYNANGDLKQLEAAILKLPADGATRKACIESYFDLATISGDGQSAATTYEKIPEALRPAAWSVAARQMSYGDLAGAKEWITAHVGDPGHDYEAVRDLVQSLSHEDPATTARWAIQLPYSAATDGIHPCTIAMLNWHRRDPAAATAWLKSQPQEIQSALRVHFEPQ